MKNRCLATSTIFTFSSFCNRLFKLRGRTLEMNIYMVNNPNWQESLAPLGYLQAWPKTWTRDCGKPTRSLITSFCVLQILLWHISSFGSTDIQLSSDILIQHISTRTNMYPSTASHSYFDQTRVWCATVISSSCLQRAPHEMKIAAILIYAYYKLICTHQSV